MQILGLLGKYFDAAVVTVANFSILFILTLAILFSDMFHLSNVGRTILLLFLS